MGMIKDQFTLSSLEVSNTGHLPPLKPPPPATIQMTNAQVEEEPPPAPNRALEYVPRLTFFTIDSTRMS